MFMYLLTELRGLVLTASHFTLITNYPLQQGGKIKQITKQKIQAFLQTPHQSTNHESNVCPLMMSTTTKL